MDKEHTSPAQILRGRLPLRPIQVLAAGSSLKHLVQPHALPLPVGALLSAAHPPVTYFRHLASKVSNTFLDLVRHLSKNSCKDFIWTEKPPYGVSNLGVV